MIKVHKATGAAFVIAGLFMTLTPSRGEADSSCSTADSCGRHVTCPTGFSTTNLVQGSYCSRQVGPSSEAPTCGFWNMRNDWTWVAASKACRNGAGTLSTQNIRCDAGSTYSSASGRCERGAGIEYAHAILTTNGAFSGTSRTCDSQSACSDPIRCTKQGFEARRIIAPGPAQGEWYCEKITPAVDEAPKCVFHNFRNDWTWVPTLKKCRNGAGTITDVNRRCDDGTYDAASGRCRTPSRTEYDEPAL
jgi:hypothetical protein